MNLRYLNDAIISLGGTNFSVQDIDTIHWINGNPNNITKEQIQTKYDELVEADKKIQYQRDRIGKYPNEHDLLIALWEKVMEGRSESADALEVKRQEVKTANPKPE